jgi:curved DNA-binding protein CbpA
VQEKDITHRCDKKVPFMPPVVRAQLDYYAVLEITPAADVVEVNAAFRRLAWRYHPDRNHAPGATLQFQDINEAHQVLTHPVRRAEYDAKWHPKTSEQHRATRPPTRNHTHRSWRRHRRVKPVLAALFSLLFVSAAWTVIFAAMTSAHSGSTGYSFAEASQITTASSLDCGYSMEMFPVTFTDDHGRRFTVWETDVRNCWGGSTRVSGIATVVPPRAFGNRTAYR